MSEQLSNVVPLSNYAKHPDDVDLVAQGFGAIYDAYLPYVATICYKLCGREEEVDDLAQEVFVQVYKSLHKLTNPAALKGWIGTIATRKTLRHLKRRRLKQWVRLEDHVSYDTLQTDNLNAEQQAMMSQIFSKLDHMPARWRTIWTLRHLEGKSNQETAQMCGCSLTTVKRELASARQLLKELADAT